MGRETASPREALKLIQTAARAATKSSSPQAKTRRPTSNRRHSFHTAGKGFMSQEPGNRIRNANSAAAAGPPGSLRATNQLIAMPAGAGPRDRRPAEVIEEVLIAVLCQGHALLEGVPGIAKTLIVKALGRLLGLGFQRVQATPDLMPADILGTTILRPGAESFSFHAGPVFTDLLLVDEINRMPPRTQAALLECMEERQVTSDGVRRPLPPWFTVFATQNPVDFEGTYPLPEAQLDRFLLKIRVSLSVETEELQILERHHAGSGAACWRMPTSRPLPRACWRRARRGSRHPHRAGAVWLHSSLARRTREWPTLLLGASPRAAMSLMRVAQALPPSMAATTWSPTT
jgi:MoxR-like ATPase